MNCRRGGMETCPAELRSSTGIRSASRFNTHEFLRQASGEDHGANLAERFAIAGPHQSRFSFGDIDPFEFGVLFVDRDSGAFIHNRAEHGSRIERVVVWAVETGQRAEPV